MAVTLLSPPFKTFSVNKEENNLPLKAEPSDPIITAEKILSNAIPYSPSSPLSYISFSLSSDSSIKWGVSENLPEKRDIEAYLTDLSIKNIQKIFLTTDIAKMVFKTEQKTLTKISLEEIIGNIVKHLESRRSSSQNEREGGEKWSAAKKNWEKTSGIALTILYRRQRG